MADFKQSAVSNYEKAPATAGAAAIPPVEFQGQPLWNPATPGNKSPAIILSEPPSHVEV